MALRKLVRRNYGGKSPVSIQYQNLHSFKEGLILLCQSIFEARRITHLHGSAPFTIPLKTVCFSKITLYKEVQRITILQLFISTKRFKSINGKKAIFSVYFH